jgi:competence protein ComEA
VTRPLQALAAAALVAAAGPAVAKKPLGPGERIDLNRASAEELMRLPGVGAKKALAILDRRSRQPFARIEDVTSVRGLGARWFARTRDHLTTGGPAPPVGPASASTSSPLGAPKLAPGSVPPSQPAPPTWPGR